MDCAPNKLQLMRMLEEAMHMKWENPTLNKQLKHADLTLLFWYYFWYSTGLFYFIIIIIIILIFSEQFVF